MPAQVGQLLKGFCDGFFGRDSHSDKRIEAIGLDWLVARNMEFDKPELATFHNAANLEMWVARWTKEQE